MSIPKQVSRMPVYGEFEKIMPGSLEEIFGIKQKKYIPNIDSLYYSVHVEGDGTEETESKLFPFLEGIAQLKDRANSQNEPVKYDHDLLVTLKSHKFYSLCLTAPDLYDIFFCRVLPNEGTPRIFVQIRSYGLWMRGVDAVAQESFDKLESIVSSQGMKLTKVRESRIDYCYHTNALLNLNSIFREKGNVIKNLHTNLSQATYTLDLNQVDGGTEYYKDYICLGKSSSNNVRARIYNKVKEVVEMGYKYFFFKLWHDSGIISFYDKYCMEYAFPYKNMDYLAKGAMQFYVDYGPEGSLKDSFKSKLSDKNVPLSEFKKIASEHMPQVTAVINVEYETKRKFYYYSDEFINSLKVREGRETHPQLARIFKILDNRHLFLDYLTSKTMSFYKKREGQNPQEEPAYDDWWRRLRNVKLDSFKVEPGLLRDYSFEMDKNLVQKRAVNAIASAAVYGDKVETDFVEDLSDFLADISDNDWHKVGLYFVDTGGNPISRVYGTVLQGYLTTKAKKEMLIKNRKKRSMAG